MGPVLRAGKVEWLHNALNPPKLPCKTLSPLTLMSGPCPEATDAFIGPQDWLVWVPAGDGRTELSQIFSASPECCPSLGRTAPHTGEGTVLELASVPLG